jgi:hypothetical protein
MYMEDPDLPRALWDASFSTAPVSAFQLPAPAGVLKT